MKNQDLSKASSVPEQKKPELRTDVVKLVEMGKVSAETKGFGRGFELGFTPKSG